MTRQPGGGVGLSRWRRLLAGGFVGGFALAIALLAAVVVAALLFLGGDEVSVSHPIEVGRGPLRLATGDGAVWATSAGDGRLWRIDPGSGEVVGQAVRLGKGLAGVTVGNGTRSGSPTTATGPSLGSSPDADGPRSGDIGRSSARRPGRVEP